jgi:hypothetical protein
MDYIDWRPAPARNVEVQNDTADLYRYFDCTEEAEFLYGCVERAIDEDLPREIDFLRRNDEAMRRVMNTVEMPDRIAGGEPHQVHPPERRQAGPQAARGRFRETHRR